jgi:tRNA(Ile)-lysidine synthase
VPTADDAIRDGEASTLFHGLEGLPGLVLAVSGGPDSTALLVLAARWAKRLKRAPKLLAVTIDHGLRPDAAREAAAVKRLARRLGVRHSTLHWRGDKPKTGLQEAARNARYHLLAQAAVCAGYGHILTAHTLDDQAETVLFRLARGSGLFGLAGMARASPLPAPKTPEIFLLRPLLHVAKARLIATLEAARIGYSDDPTNRDPRYTRARGSDHRGGGRSRAQRAGAAAVAAARSDRVRNAAIRGSPRRGGAAAPWRGHRPHRQRGCGRTG